jgi:hypothetical protein
VYPIFKNLPKENNRPTVENSPNPVTLDMGIKLQRNSFYLLQTENYQTGQKNDSRNRDPKKAF